MNLDQLRQRVDEINVEIISLLSRRLDVTKEIAKVKKEQRLPVHDPVREKLQVQMLKEAAQRWNLSPAIIEEIFEIFVDYSKVNMKMEMGHD